MNPLLEIFYLAGGNTPRNPIGSNILFDFPKGTYSPCPNCGTPIAWKTHWDNVRFKIIGGAVEFYPDFIFGSNSIISQRMLDDLVVSEISGFKAHPVNLIAVESKKLKSQNAPQYFIMEVLGMINMDREKWDNFDGNLCPICNVWEPRKGGIVTWGDNPTIPLMDSWDGSDFMRFRNIKIGGDLCSRKVLELAQEKKWSGFGARALLPGWHLINLAEPDWSTKLLKKINSV